MEPQRRGTPDFLLLSLTVILTCFGILMVFSASSATAAIKFDDPLWFTKRQIIFAVLGLSAMLVLMNVPYEKLKKWFIPYYFTIVAALVVVLFREPLNGARSWLQIGSFGIQPSEFAKLGVILYLAALISKKGDKIRDFKRGLLPVMIIVGFTTGLIIAQPDFGSAIVLVLCSAFLILAGGANLKHLFLLGTTGVVSLAATVGIYLLIAENPGYRFARFTTFLDPWSDYWGSGWQIVHSLYAFGHGGLTGAGFGKSIQKLHYLPEAHNDFIFAIIGEELGLIGAGLFLLVYIVFIWRIIAISLRAPDTFGMLVGIGVAVMLAVQALINMGGVTNAIPMTGVTLPLISSGGSSLLTTLASLGIVLSISRESNRRND
jgi:cell division protein FtsW